MNLKHLSAFLSLIMLLVLSSCSNEPKTKDDYIQKFENFTQSVEKDYKSYSDDVWKKKDVLYNQFSEEWYRKYEDVLDFKEKVEVKKMAIKYKLYRNGSKLKDGLETGVEALIEMGEDVLELLDSVNVEINTNNNN